MEIKTIFQFISSADLIVGVMLVKPIIPIYKPQKHEVQKLLNDLPQEFLPPLLIVSDTNDELLDEIYKIGESRKAEIINIGNQIGKLETIRTGIITVLKDEDIEIFFQLDARNKQVIDRLQLMVDKLINENADMIVANRYATQDMNSQNHRISISSFVSKIINYLTGYELQDTACGTRAYTRNLANHFINLRGYGYGLELEQLIFSSKLKMKVIDYPLISNLQADGTNAEKLEDNFMVIINYISEIKMEKAVKETLCYALTMIKKRNSFSLIFSENINIPSVHFEYVGSGSIIDAYTNQALQDAYKVKTL